MYKECRQKMCPSDLKLIFPSKVQPCVVLTKAVPWQTLILFHRYRRKTHRTSLLPRDGTRVSDVVCSVRNFLKSISLKVAHLCNTIPDYMVSAGDTAINLHVRVPCLLVPKSGGGGGGGGGGGTLNQLKPEVPTSLTIFISGMSGGLWTKHFRERYSVIFKHKIIVWQICCCITDVTVCHILRM